MVLFRVCLTTGAWVHVLVLEFGTGLEQALDAPFLLPVRLPALRESTTFLYKGYLSPSELRLQEDGNATTDTDKESTLPIYLFHLPRAFVLNILLECTADLVGKQQGLKR